MQGNHPDGPPREGMVQKTLHTATPKCPPKLNSFWPAGHKSAGRSHWCYLGQRVSTMRSGIHKAPLLNNITVFWLRKWPIHPPETYIPSASELHTATAVQRAEGAVPLGDSCCHWLACSMRHHKGKASPTGKLFTVHDWARIFDFFSRKRQRRVPSDVRLLSWEPVIGACLRSSVSNHQQTDGRTDEHLAKYMFVYIIFYWGWARSRRFVHIRW